MHRMQDDPKPAASTPLPMTEEAARQLALWEQLHRELLDLHAKLEYTRLMLKIGVVR